jgi:hypothetical protein
MVYAPALVRKTHWIVANRYEIWIRSESVNAWRSHSNEIFQVTPRDLASGVLRKTRLPAADAHASSASKTANDCDDAVN